MFCIGWVPAGDNQWSLLPPPTKTGRVKAARPTHKWVPGNFGSIVGKQRRVGRDMGGSSIGPRLVPSHGRARDPLGQAQRAHPTDNVTNSGTLAPAMCVLALVGQCARSLRLRMKRILGIYKLVGLHSSDMGMPAEIPQTNTYTSVHMVGGSAHLDIFSHLPNTKTTLHARGLHHRIDVNTNISDGVR